MRISVGSRGAAVLALVALSAGVSAVGCSSPNGSSRNPQGSEENSGSIGLELQAGGLQLDAIQYTILGNGFVKSGTLNVANSTRISAVIGGIPAGNGYSITLSAVDAANAATTCSGSASFSVSAGATTSAQVHLTCRAPARTGSVIVNGTVNVCPAIGSLSLEPAETTVGHSVALSAAASDPDQPPSALSYSWTSTSGTLTGGASANASLACTTAGTATLTVIVSDGDCTDTASATVTCSPDVGAGGAGGAGGGANGAGGSGGPAGSGGAGNAGAGGGSALIRINEVESNGDVDDWCELYNAGSAPVDISGWIFRDNDDTHAYVIPNGTVVAPGAYFVLEGTAFTFGLGAPDATRLFNGTTLVDSFSWTTHAAITYGRCPNGTGGFSNTASSTKGAANDCGALGGGGASGAGGAGGAAGSGGAGSGGAAGSAGTGGAVGSAGAGGAAGSANSFATWPGGNSVATVDNADVFGTNLSGLFYDPPNAGAPAVLWAVQNGPSKLYRLLWNGTVWAPDTDNNWGAGHTIAYTTGLGGPDSEGVTKAAFGTTGLYVSTERDNTANTVSRLSVLLYDSTATSTTVSASMDWNLSADFNLPASAANLGLEAIAWVPDTYLTLKGFIDESTNAAYDPARYPNHAGGLFFVGLEADGMIYAYALNHTDSSFMRVATIASGNPSIMDLSFDRDVGYLWAACDNTCNGRTNVLDVDTRAGSATRGKFVIRQGFERPSTLPNTNNEGFSLTPESTCQGGFKDVFYSDDNNLDGHAIRRDSVPCGAFLGAFL